MSEREPLFSLLENTPSELLYIPHGFYWLWLMIRHRGTALPASANPGIYMSDLSGQSKRGLYELMGDVGRKQFAPFVSIVAHETPREDIASLMHGAGLSFPVVAKPDIGRNGRGVKIVEDMDALVEHCSKFPRGTRMMIQRLITEEGEAGIFYVRKPSEPSGRISSLTLKYFPSVVGDGTATVRELILRDPRASKIKDLYFRRNHKYLDTVLAKGERHKLVTVGNHIRGALFEDGELYITPEMVAAFDTISKEITGFYFGRFDVRYSSLEELKQGKGFTIIEYNGASSEPTHVWDRRTSFWKTYRDLLAHWRYAFEIGAENRARGAQTFSLAQVLREYQKELALVLSYPDEE